MFFKFILKLHFVEQLCRDYVTFLHIEFVHVFQIYVPGICFLHMATTTIY